MIESNTEKCVRLLDDVFCFEGNFNFHLALTRLELYHKFEGRINIEEYLKAIRIIV